MKRPAEVEAEQLQSADRATAERPSETTQSPAQVNDALMVDRDVICSVLSQDPQDVHPLARIFCEACIERENPLEAQVVDHGSWDGRWSLPSKTEWLARQRLGLLWPKGADEINDTLAVQAARKEYHWSSMNGEQKKAFDVAAETGWSVWTSNDAVEVLDETESLKVRAELRAKNEEAKILTPRWVFTDKHDGLRTAQNDLPLKASARLVVPGFKDVLSFTLRKDAPTASRTSQHFLFTFTAAKFACGWRLLSVDVKSAFMKGDPYLAGTRELYLENVKGNHGEPRLPFSSSRGLARIKKGVFGLSDAPRQWYLRLNRALTELGWERNPMDAACWMLWSKDRKELQGIVLSHVDDLLCGGSEEARASILSLEKELGFGSVEHDSFTYCGKKIAQDETGCIHVSMVEYHENMKVAPVPLHRRRCPEAALTPAEQKQLRALLGSLQWLVAQVRIDQGFSLSTLQGEQPTISTLLRANALVRDFKASKQFALCFRPMDLDGAGIMVVTDSSLGNVTKSGGSSGGMVERVFSQSAYVVLLADKKLMNGEPGSFCLLDARSHRLPRVCRSTFAAELLGSEEAFDVGQYCRGLFAVVQGLPMENRHVDAIMDSIAMCVVVDAKDVYDKGTSDTPSYGAQRSLGFTVAWIRAMLRKPNTALRWTSTENMFVDCGTKDMDLSHMRDTLTSGKWCAKYTTKFIKQSVKNPKSKAKVTSDFQPPGHPLSESHVVFPYLHRLCEAPGWHFEDHAVIQVARNAKSFRHPAPRCDPQKYPLRSSYARFDRESGFSEWRVLEEQIPYSELANSKAPFGGTAAALVTVYHPLATKEKNQLLK